ncbi:MAG: DUF459 domain-containing protein [Aquihabitans sp.]
MTAEHNYPPEPVERRRAPAGQAMMVLLTALLMGSLLNADRLDYTARTQPYGVQRSWAMGITGVLKSISHATLLNRPRLMLSKAAGNVDPPPAIDTKGVVIVKPTTPGQASGTTTTTPPDYRVPTDSDPLRILVSGDSLMGWIGPAISQELDGKPIAVTEDWKVATGLARPDVRNWPVQLAADVKQYDPEVVILGFGGNDMQDIATDHGRVSVGTPEWRDEYQRRVAQVLNAVAGENRTVYWLGLPITTRANIEKAAPIQRAAVKAEISARPWAHFVDTRPLLSPDGIYTAYLPDGSGGEVKVREGDGVHPNLAGASRMVRPITAALVKDRKLDPPPRLPAVTTTRPTATTRPSG